MTIECKAIITQGKGDYELASIEVGMPRGNEVRVKIKAASLCHTDWDSLSWGSPYVVGHEGAGVVEAIGPDVVRVKVGDAVVLNWAIPCGHCSTCSSGRRNICEKQSPVTGNLAGHAHGEATKINGENIQRSFHLGTLSEYTVVREEAVVKLDGDIPFSSATLMGCGVMTGYGSVVNASRLMAGETVAVLGCGGVGLNAIQGAKIAGAKAIFAIDKSEARLAQAKEFGATHGLQSDSNENLRKAICEENGGYAADVAIECTAIPELGDAPLALVRNGGRAIQASGIEQSISFDCELFEWDKTYLNPLYGQCDPDRDFPRLMAHYHAGRLKLDEQVSRVWNIEEIKEAFEALLSGQGAKNVIEFD